MEMKAVAAGDTTPATLPASEFSVAFTGHGFMISIGHTRTRFAPDADPRPVIEWTNTFYLSPQGYELLLNVMAQSHEKAQQMLKSVAAVTAGKTPKP